MNKITDELYERFKKNLESVNGTCVRASKADLGKAVAGIFTEAGIPDTCIVETPLMKEAGVINALEEAGIKVYTDHIRLNAEKVKGGVSESQFGIADLGTMVQARDVIDERLVSTMSEYYIGILKGSTIVPEYDDSLILSQNGRRCRTLLVSLPVQAVRPISSVSAPLVCMDRSSFLLLL